MGVSVGKGLCPACVAPNGSGTLRHGPDPYPPAARLPHGCGYTRTGDGRRPGSRNRRCRVDQPGTPGCADAGGARCRRVPAAGRRSVCGQRQHRRGRPAHDCRVPGADHHARPPCARRAAPGGCGRDRGRQDQHGSAGDGAGRRALALWRAAQPVRRGGRAGGQQFGVGRGGGRGARKFRARHGYGRVGKGAGGAEQCGGAEADARLDQYDGRRARLPVVGLRVDPGIDGGGCAGGAERGRGLRRRRPVCPAARATGVCGAATRRPRPARVLRRRRGR